ncbi:hypothetical protein FDB52_06940 [Clostridium botulinum]|nr:hypothetical protein [Clostridium botulinum]NFN48287.1 hypothetical protein [Clostridium botulinum]
MHEGECIVVENVIIDTGAFHTIISTDFLDELGAKFADDDKLIEASGYGGGSSYAVRKRIDGIACDNMELKDFKIDFGEIHPNEIVNGLLGLDFLMKAELVIDLVELIMYKKN